MGFQIIGADWRYVYVNPAAAGHGRRSVNELVGRTMMETYPGIEGTPLFAVLKRSMEQRTSEIHENFFTFPDGDARWFEIRVEPVQEGICVYSLDIHERKIRDLQAQKRAEELEKELHIPLRRLLWRT